MSASRQHLDLPTALCPRLCDQLSDSPLWEELPVGAAETEAIRTHADCRVCQKPTTRSAVDGIRRAKFTRALSISAGAAHPARAQPQQDQRAHRRPFEADASCRRSGSDRSGRRRSGGRGLRSSPPTSPTSAATDSSYLWPLAKPSSAASFSSPARCSARIVRCAGAKSRRLSTVLEHAGNLAHRRLDRRLPARA